MVKTILNDDRARIKVDVSGGCVNIIEQLKGNGKKIECETTLMFEYETFDKIAKFAGYAKVGDF